MNEYDNFYFILNHYEPLKLDEENPLPIEYYVAAVGSQYTKKDILNIIKKLNFRGFQNLKKDEILKFLYSQKIDFNLLI